MAARVLQAVARFVREFAEIHFPRMAREAKHEDVRAGAENPVLGARHHHAANFGMLEADPLHGVVQLDIDAQVVRVELEFVAVAHAAVLGHVENERRHRSFEAKLPVSISGRLGSVIDVQFAGHGSSKNCPAAGIPVPDMQNNAVYNLSKAIKCIHGVACSGTG